MLLFFFSSRRRHTRLTCDLSSDVCSSDLSARVPHALRLDLDELAVERDSVLLHGRAESFDAVDALRRALSASPLLADVTAGETRTTVAGSSSGCARRGSRPWERAREAPRRLARHPLRT